MPLAYDRHTDHPAGTVHRQLPPWQRPLSLEESLQLAKARNPLLQTAQWDKAIAQHHLRQADSSLYPRIDAQGGYTALAWNHRPCG